MKWQARTVAALLVTILAAASAQTQFNMGGVGGTNASAESYLPQAESMGSNWTQINCSDLSSGVVDGLLNEAYTLGIRVFLDHAGLSAGAPNIMSIAGGQYTEYQAESLRSPGDVGNLASDGLAPDGHAWRVDLGDAAGWFQTQFKDDVFSNRRLSAYFRLRADTGAAADTVPVCKLQVARTSGDTDAVDADTVLLARDFPASDSYSTFALRFQKSGGNSEFKLKVYWYRGIDSLWSDYAELCDSTGDSLMRGLSPTPYAQAVQDIASHYNPFPAVYRYYLADEARPCQFACCGEVNRILRGLPPPPGQPVKSGINWMNWWSGHQDRYENYVAAVHPSEFWCDMYPLMGRTWPSQLMTPPPESLGGSRRTPVDSGFVFQTQLDSYCLVLDTARVVAARHNIPLWVDAQAYGEVITDSSHHYNSYWDTLTDPPATPRNDESVWRLPSSREFLCLSWLPLAYGAKGLDYWTRTYASTWTYHEYWRGPADTLKYYYVLGVHKWDVGNGRPSHEHTHMFDLVRDFFDSTLKKIAPTLLNLRSVDAGQWNGAAIDFVTGCTDNLLQLGTFYDTIHPSDKYFIVVNRHCLPTDTISPTVTIGEWGVGLCDEVTGETLYGVPNETPGYLDFSVWLPPGGGRLFRLIPVIPGAWTRLTDVPPGPRSKSVRDGGALAFAEDDTGFDDAGC